MVLSSFILKQLVSQYVIKDAEKVLDFCKATIVWDTEEAIVWVALPSAPETSVSVDILNMHR